MKGILVNTEFCTGCHACEVACKKHLDLPVGQFGIKLLQARKSLKAEMLAEQE